MSTAADYQAFYQCYSTGAAADAEPIDRDEVVLLVERHLLHRGDFVGLTDTDGTTAQVMRGGADRAWFEIIDMPNEGAHGAHMTIDEAVAALVAVGLSPSGLQPALTFSRWDGSSGPVPFAIPADKIRVIAPNLGSCISTNYVTRGDRGVNYMYREAPTDSGDSGWRFFTGTETDDYLQVASNLGMYDVNTIANYEPDIVPLLSALTGAQFERQDDGGWARL